MEGVASRLGDHADRIQLVTVSPQEEDLIGRLVAVQPDAIILDASDPDGGGACPMMEMLRRIPEARIILLDTERSDFQVIRSQRRPIDSTEALVDEMLEVL